MDEVICRVSQWSKPRFELTEYSVRDTHRKMSEI